MRNHPSSRVLRPVSAALLAAFFSTSFAGLQAQSLYGFDGAASTVLEFTGPPAGLCGYPTGPLISGFATPAAYACPVAVALGPPPAVLGDIAVDKFADTVWVTDGVNITEYTTGGAVLNSFAPAIVPLGPLTGLGYDSTAGMLWVTDGAMAAAIFPPLAPGCAPPALATPPFPLPVAAAATDIEWDSRTGSLWVCDVGGVVTNVLIGGAIGPFGAFPLAAAVCPIGPVLQGIAVDDASVAPGVLYVTDGAAVAYIDAATAGGPAPLTFYTTATCTPTPGPLLGLAFAAHAISYGAGSDSTGGVPPVMASLGHSVSPGFGLVFTITGGIPGATAGLLYGMAGPLCPPIPVAGVLLLVLPPLFSAGTVTLTATGAGALIAPLPAGLVGVPFWLQWVVVAPGPVLQMTAAMEVTGSAP